MSSAASAYRLDGHSQWKEPLIPAEQRQPRQQLVVEEVKDDEEVKAHSTPGQPPPLRAEEAAINVSPEGPLPSSPDEAPPHFHTYLVDDRVVAVSLLPSVECRQRGCGDSYRLPTITATSIAFSASYQTTYWLLIAACALWTAGVETSNLVGAVPLTGWSKNFHSLPWVLERIFCFGGLGVSALLFTRRFEAQQPPPSPLDEAKASLAGRVRRLLALVTLRGWCSASLLVFALMAVVVLPFSIFDYNTFSLGVLQLLMAVAVLAYIAFPFLLFALWRLTRPHPLTASGGVGPDFHLSPTEESAVSGSPSVASAPVVRGRAWLVLCLVAFVVAEPGVKYLVNELVTPLAHWVVDHIFPYLMLASAFVLALAGLVLVVADRRAIQRGEVSNDAAYVVVALGLQLCLPHIFYEGWLTGVMPVYHRCSTHVVVQTLLVVGFHGAFAVFQPAVQVFSLLAVQTPHSAALVFYLQWFEDFTGDVTFGNVDPFSGAFFMYAAVTTVKLLLRDSNLLRNAGNELFLPESDTEKGGEDDQQPRAAEARPLSLQGRVRRFIRRLCGGGAWSALYARYVASFDLTLNRHQLFLVESCSKVTLITVCLYQYAFPKTAALGGAFYLDMAGDEKLKLAGGFAFLWLLQLLTHMAVLAILRHRQPSQVCITVQDSAGVEASPSANVVQLMCHRELQRVKRSEQEKIVGASEDDVSPSPTRRIGRCRCPSCTLSYSEYVMAWGRARSRRHAQEKKEEKEVNEAAGEWAERDAGEWADAGNIEQVTPAPLSAGCRTWAWPTRCPRLHASLSPLVHPCINYWTVHRWFFALQMLHWIWFILTDEEAIFEYGCESA